MDIQSLVIKCAQIADDKKAKDIVILHVEEQFMISDYFIVCSGMNPRHVKTIAQEIYTELKKNKCSYIKLEGLEESKWVLIDAGDFLVHIYLEELRTYYELEDLWADAPKLEFQQAQASNNDG